MEQLLIEREIIILEIRYKSGLILNVLDNNDPDYENLEKEIKNLCDNYFYTEKIIRKEYIKEIKRKERDVKNQQKIELKQKNNELKIQKKIKK